MKNARLFKTDGEVVIISADDVLSGKVSKDSEFVDLEYEFKTQFVKDCKGHKGPYFRLYLSRDDYQRLSNEQKTRYDIVSAMRRYQESVWHAYWKDKFKSTCEIEKAIKSDKSKKYKRADAFCEKINTCLEFQHSFIAMDFEERNSFYKELGIQIIWLYDLTKLNVKAIGENEYEILEDNSKGYFKIADFKDNLEKYQVYFQAKDKLIYRITSLRRKEIDDDRKSTIRIFNPLSIWTEDEFVENVISEKFEPELKTIDELWSKTYSAMVIEDTEKGEWIKITGRKDGTMYRGFDYDVLLYEYVDEHYCDKSYKDYFLKNDERNKKKWKLIKAYLRNN